MNLLIEQRPTTITSKIQQKQKQQQQQSNSNDVNNNLSSSPLILKIKRQTTKQQINHSSTSLSMANDDTKNNNSRLTTTTTTHNQRLKRPITNQTTRRSSSPAFNSKQQQQQQATKRSVTIDNNNNDLNPNIDDLSSKKRFKQDDLNQSSTTTTTKVDASVETVSIGLATEPDQLGPCEPGTSVILEGIVWNETDSGVLVVNVTWRGKTYVGTLLDSTKQDWACPRLTCESPTSDYDVRNSSKTSRAKRSNISGNNRCSNYQTISSSFQQLSSNTFNTGCDDRKLRNNIKSRQSKRLQLNTIDDLSTINNSSSIISPYISSTNNDIQLISCPELQCHKQFISNIALQYHLSNAHKKIDSLSSSSSSSTISIQQANTRDEEDVAHILANVADYVRRPSPEHQRQTTLTWPCPQISSNLVRSSPLNNNEQISIHLSTNPTRCILNNNEINTDQDEIKSTLKSTDHFLLHMQDESSSWTNLKIDQTHTNKKSIKIPTPPPSSSSSFVPINNLTSTIQTLPIISSSPAYSDISDEESTTTANENEQKPPSTINLLTATNGKFDENDQTLISNSTWTTTQMLLQQYGPYMQQQTFIDKDLTSNRLNSSKTNSNSSTSDSTVKNILDSRRLSTTKSSPSSSTTSITNDSNTLLNDYQKTLYHYHTNGIINDTKLSTTTTIVNSLTSPNENLLNLSTTNPLDYSLHNTSSSTIHPSR
ncbi:unnamed protein product [Rotaria sp. Silwood1]|nr:unnamed protein product [Rotaria sp. Silwood1]CAF3711590.1 unnamed protein product [Rotaria sp. Silwood1]CAF4680771.1 unnamed protein product [Rotaria sp. Silwood1]CAF4827838.1 unnamed protein product [Rotaria sp. Silwood1]